MVVFLNSDFPGNIGAAPYAFAAGGIFLPFQCNLLVIFVALWTLFLSKASSKHYSLN